MGRAPGALARGSPAPSDSKWRRRVAHRLVGTERPPPSPAQIDGIWHTGIVVYGTEYYFGGGIQAGPPGRTHFGRPLQAIDLGETQVPKDLFLEFLEGVTVQFSFETYDLMSNNCNNFSNAAAEFLLGKGIPGHIVNLPSEVLSSPLAPMLTPLLSQMRSARPRSSHVPWSECPSGSLLRTCCCAAFLCGSAGSLRVTEDGPSAPPVSPFGHLAGAAGAAAQQPPAAPAAAARPAAAAAPAAAAGATPPLAAATAASAAAAAAAEREKERDRDVAAHGGTPTHDTGAAAPSTTGAGAPPEKDDEAKRAAFKKAVAAEFERLRKEKPEISASEAAADAVAAVLLRVEAGEDL